MPDEKLAPDENEMKELRDAGARWQRIRVDQLGFLTNLLTGLAAGLIALDANVAFSKLDNIQIGAQRYLLYSIIVLLLSIAIGIIMAWNRLWDFRTTFRTIRLRQRRLKTNEPKKQTTLTKEVNDLRNLTNRLGRITDVLLILQGVTFVAGALALLRAVAFQLKIV